MQADIAGIVAIASCTALVAPAAYAATLGELTLRPTIASIGVEVAVTGDDDGDATVALAYRVAGGADFVAGHPLVRSGARGLGSVLFLEPATSYEVRVTLSDPDDAAPSEREATATTRADAPVAATGATLHVDAAAAAGGDGSPDAPFSTIQGAIDAAGPGVTVRVAPGVYREELVIEGANGGSEAAPVHLVAEPGAVLDGGDPALEDGTAFTDEGSGLWSAPFTGECRYAAVDDLRLYDYPSLAELTEGTAGIDGGFFADAAAGRVYLRLPGGAAPSGHTLHFARLGVAILLDTVTDVVVEGFEIRYFGTVEYSGVGVDVRDTARAWIRNNSLHHLNEGIRIRRPLASDNVVEGNTVRDTSVWTWPWDAVKAHTPEASAVSVTGGGGNVVRRNTFTGTFNGVYVGSFDDPSESIARDTDVYENVFGQHGDDGFEPEGAAVNVRFFNNAMHGVYNGVSLAPIAVGPLFLVRNLVAGYRAHALKVNNAPTGHMFVYHTTAEPAAGVLEAQAFAPSEPFAHLTTRNNVWAAHRYVLESSVTPSGPLDLDYDALYTDSLDGTVRFVKWLDVRYDDLAALVASATIEEHGFAVVPEYEEPATGDYMPVAGSGLLDVGLPVAGINDRTTIGAGPDLGAFERGGVTPPIDAGPGGAGGAATGGFPPGGAGATGGAGTNGGGSGATSDQQATGDDSGCGCRISSDPRRARDGALLLAALGLLVRAARRRSSALRHGSVRMVRASPRRRWP